MGIIPDREWALLPEQYSTVLDLGNKKNSHGVYRDQYEAHGKVYKSLDINGLDGAMALDMCETILPETAGGPFDVVTNFGFSEHVSNQEMCWRNTHGFIKNSGYMVFVLPEPHSWLNHSGSIWHFSKEFYPLFAHFNGYEIEELYRDSKNALKVSWLGRMKKTSDCAFTWNDQIFSTLWLKQ